MSAKRMKTDNQVLLRATTGARNPNLQVVITHTSHVCMQPAFVRTSTKNEWNVQKAIRSRAFGLSIPRYLITRVLTICHVKLMQSTTMEQKRFDLRYLAWHIDFYDLGQAKRRTFHETNQTLTQVDPNQVKIVCWVRRRTNEYQDASNESTESDQRAILINFTRKGPKYTYHTDLIYQSSLSLLKIDLVPQTIFRRSTRLKQTDRTCWTIQLIQTNLTEPNVDLFMNLTH